jgi:formate dehydrogenase subunit gamma
MIERYTFNERICHWLTGFSYLYSLATGLAFYSPHMFWMAIALGGGPTSRFWHPWIGLLFFAGAMWMHSLWRTDLKMSDVDYSWLEKAEDYAANRDELLPPQGRFNAGQKLFYWAMFYGALLLIVTGLVMWFPESIPFRIGWIRPVVVILHEAAALITIGAFIVHVYMGIFMVPGSLTAITQGWVTDEFARAHHRLWYEKVK